MVIKHKKPTIIAHRGYSSQAPENTLAAFQKALAHPIDFIEFDVHLSRDGIPVVIHDETLERTTNAKEALRVSELTVQELKQFDAGSWYSAAYTGVSIPTLAEVLQTTKGAAGCMIEVKAGGADPEKAAAAVLAEVETHTPYFSQSSILIGSFDPAILTAVRKQNPRQPLIGITDDRNELESWLKWGVKHIAVRADLITPQLARILHQQEIEVWGFTIDELALAQKLLKSHLNGIITNDLGKMQTLFFGKSRQDDRKPRTSGQTNDNKTRSSDHIHNQKPG